MHLTRFSDNALRCLLLLGLEPGRAIPVPEIADRMRMSYNHLVKVVQLLSQFGYVETTRGRHGGLQLARAPEDILLGQLLRQTEESLALVECFSPEISNCPIVSACKLAPTLARALNAFFRELDHDTLADVLKPRRELVRLTRHTD